MNRAVPLVLLGITFGFGIILIYDSALVLLVRTFLGNGGAFGFDVKEFAIGITAWVAAGTGLIYLMQTKGIGYRLLGATLVGMFFPLFFAFEIQEAHWYTSNVEVRNLGSQGAYRKVRKRYLQWEDNSAARAEESERIAQLIAQQQVHHRANGLQQIAAYAVKRPEKSPAEKLFDVSTACGETQKVDPASMALVEQAAGTGYEYKFQEPVESRLRQAIAIDDANWLAYDRLARWYLLVKQQPQNALGVYQQALANRPGCPTGHFNVAGVHSKLKQYDKAIEHIQQAIALTDEVPASYHYNLGNAYLKSSQAQAAVSAYEAALQRDPDHTNAHRNLTRAHLELRNIDRLLELQAGNADSLRRLGVSLSRLREPKHAVRFYTAALAIEQQADTFYNLAVDLALLKRFSESRNAANQALTIQADHSGALSVLRLLDEQ